jgi:hemerythrin-like domain-containing protein
MCTRGRWRFKRLFEQEIAIHFAAEEKHLFPMAVQFQELAPLVNELQSEHADLRDLFSRAASRTLDEQGLASLAAKLSQHIRKEERRLFEGMQKLISPEDLSVLGAALNEELKDAPETCLLPNEATRLRPRS